MAKVFGPALSIEAAGTIKNAITFQRRPSGSSFIKRPVPTGDASSSQAVIRAYVKAGVAFWRSMEVWEKQKWNDYIY